MDWYSLKEAIAFMIIAGIYPYYIWGIPNFVFELVNSKDINNAIQTIVKKETYKTIYFVKFRTCTYLIIGAGLFIYAGYVYLFLK